MGSLSIWHWIIVLMVVLVLFGGRGKISSLMGDFASGIKAFKKGMADDDVAWTQWAIDRIAAGAWAKPDIVACEYGGVGEPFKWRTEARCIEEQVPRLLDMVRGATAR